VPRFKFALRGAFASTALADRAQTDQMMMSWGNPAASVPVVLCSNQFQVWQRIHFSELGPDTESTRMSGEPDTVKASKQ
jgi:hypothetical protein